MSYRTHAVNNQGLVEGLRSVGVLTSRKVMKAMLKVDRGDFSKDATLAYSDRPHEIGYGQTISAPHMHVYAVTALEEHLKPGGRVLDVGSGSGYLCAIMAHMMEGTGKVVGIDIVQPLISWSIENMKKHHQGLIESKTVELMFGDGWEGNPENAPFDAIHVGAGASERLMQIDKDSGGRVTQKDLMGVQYVPLVKHRGHQTA